MRESTKFALTVASIALLVGGFLSFTLAKSVNNVGRVVAVGFETSASAATAALVPRSSIIKGDRLPLKATVSHTNELADGTPLEEVEIHKQEINDLPPNTTRIAKQ